MLPASRDPRYRSLDIWRGVACLLIVVHHAGFAVDRVDVTGVTPGSWARWLYVGLVRMANLGVPIFFVISGYCIAASADANRRRGLTSWSFLARRFRRIYPPYWIALLGFAGLIAGLDLVGLSRLHLEEVYALGIASPSALDWSQWVGNITLTEAWRAHLWGLHDTWIYPNIAWTLCHEEQFYLLSFLALCLAPRRLYAALTVFTALTVAFRVCAWRMGWLARIDGTFPVFWHEFAAGMAVYWRLNIALTGWSKRLIEVLLATMLAVAVVWKMRATGGAAIFALSLIALRDHDARMMGLACLRPIAACGRRCYSIYLTHMAFCTIGNSWLCGLGMTGFWTRALVVVPLVSVAATAVGWVFFDLVEKHFLHAPSTEKPTPSVGEPGVRATRRRTFKAVS